MTVIELLTMRQKNNVEERDRYQKALANQRRAVAMTELSLFELDRENRDISESLNFLQTARRDHTDAV